MSIKGAALEEEWLGHVFIHWAAANACRLLTDTHPGIVTLLDCTYDRRKQSFMIATEWMDALSLKEHMRPEERIPEQV